MCVCVYHPPREPTTASGGWDVPNAPPARDGSFSSLRRLPSSAPAGWFPDDDDRVVHRRSRRSVHPSIHPSIHHRPTGPFADTFPSAPPIQNVDRVDRVDDGEYSIRAEYLLARPRFRDEIGYFSRPRPSRREAEGSTTHTECPNATLFWSPDPTRRRARVDWTASTLDVTSGGWENKINIHSIYTAGFDFDSFDDGCGRGGGENRAQSVAPCAHTTDDGRRPPHALPEETRARGERGKLEFSREN